MTVTWQTLISVAAIVAATIALWGYITKVVHFMDKQKQQDTDIAELRKRHIAETMAVSNFIKYNNGG